MKTENHRVRRSVSVVGNRIKLLAVGLLAAAGTFAARADSLTWDPLMNGGTGGTGTWNLTSANWWNGSADERWLDTSPFGTNSAFFSGTAGTVTLNTSLSTSNLQFSASGYTLSGSGTLTLGAGGIDASALSSGTTTIGVPLILAAGQQLWQAGSGSTLAINGAVTRATGATVDFSSSGVTSTSLANDNTGILGPWATIGGANSASGDWASASGGAIGIYTGYTAVSTTASSSPSLTGTASQNWQTGDPTGANNYVTTITGNATINSLVQMGDVGLNSGVTLTLNSGGLILRGVSRWMLGGTSCYLTTGNSTGELFVHAPDSGSGLNWTIWPIIEDNGSTPLILVKDGVDEVKLGNLSTYTGGTLVNAGILASTAGAEYGNGNAPTGIITPFGAGPITVRNGAELELGSNPGNTFGEYDYTNNITLDDGIIFESDAFEHVKGALTIGAGGGTLGATYDNKGDALLNGFAKGLFIDGDVAGSGPVTVEDSGLDTANAWDSSTVYFTSQGTVAQNPYSGTITVTPWASEGGTYLYLIGANALANATINLAGDNDASSGRFGSPALLFGSGTNLDGVGYATIGGLAGSGDFPLADTLVSQSGSSLGTGVTLTVGNNNASTTYSGVMSGAGSLIKVGTGTLTLSGAETYTGNTTVNGGDLVLTGGFVDSTNITVGVGATLDVSALGPITLSGSQALYSGGTVNGTVNTSSGTRIYAGLNGEYGTNAITGSFTFATGALAYFALGNSATGANDLMTVAGTLTANNNVIHIAAPSTSSSLEATDYVLFSSPNAISGSFGGAPSWDVQPVNAGNFSIVTSGNTVKLHYSAAAAPSGAGSATPATVVRNQQVLVSVIATNGSAGTVDSVVVNASAIGGSASLALVSAGGNVWTNIVTVGAATLAGSQMLAATLKDTASLTAIVNIPLTIVAGNDVWNGDGANNNFSSNLNWTNQTAPGYVGDSLEFAGSTRLTPNMDNNYTVAGVTFDAGAGSFNIGSSDGSTLTLSGSGPLINNSVNGQILNVAMADLGGGVTKSGNGAVTLAANNTYTGQTVVDAGTLNLAGSGPSTANVFVGSAAGNSVLGFSGALSPYYVLVGNVANAVGAIYQTGGILNANTNSGYDDLSIGNVAGSYGYYDAIGGTCTINGIAVAGEDNSGSGSDFSGPAGNGIMDINGGTVNCTGWFVMSRNANATTGILNIYSGLLAYAGGGLVCDWGAGQTTTINVMGGTLVSSNSTVIGFLNGGTGTLNLLGGVTSVSAVNGDWDGANGQVNFNGGTLQAVGASTAFVNVTAADVYSGGATIDNNGNAITVAQPLLAPTGKGVHGITSFTGGAGYIAPPIVAITPGAGDSTGTGATAVAQINPLTGAVTNILITCPGVNYTATPIFTLSGGGATTPAAVVGAAPTANTSGGLTSIGTGTLTLSGVNTYSGATMINGGTLSLTGSINDSTNVIVGSGATFDVSGITFVLGAGQSLSGFGNVNGSVEAVAGAQIYGGTEEVYGTNTFNDNLQLDAGSAVHLNLGTSAVGANSQVIVEGALTANNNIIHLKAPSTSSVLDATASYVLLTAGSISGSFASAPIWDVAPANAGHYSVVTSGNTVTLQYSATSSSPTVTASANPATLLRNQSTTITAVVTPGNSPIATVKVDLSPLGGSVVSLIESNATTTYTNAVTVPAAATPGSYTLTVTATDTGNLSGSTGAPVTIVASTEVWDGGGANENWSTNPNWVSGLAPGLVGDSITFAGTQGLTPNLDNNYSIAGLAFSSTAGSFTLGSANGSALTLTGTGPIVNNSANTQIVNVPVADDNGGITMSGVGAVTLAGNNTYTGPTMVSTGTLDLTGNSVSTANVIVGGSTGNSLLNVSGSGSITPYYLLAGNASGAVGAVYQTGGTVTASAASGYDNLSIGNMPGSFGYYAASGGTLTANGIAVAGEANNGSVSTFGLAGNGILEINGGSVIDSGWLVIARNNNATNGTEVGVLNVYSGSLTYAGGGIVGPWDTGEAAIINILGGSVANSAAVGVYLGDTGYSGILNLNGGLLEASEIAGYNGPSYAVVSYGQLNFNGGTLQASAASSDFITVTTANIYSGGATIDNNGNAITISQPLLAPAGKGVHGISSFTGGAGYIAPPIVIVTNGPGDTTGTGATAIAQINPQTGTVTNVIITCPGVDYTATPGFLVSGGGATTAATITGMAPTANTSGGLTAVGSGTTTLAGANTYTGDTAVNAGTLEIVNPVLARTSTVTVASGAVLQLDFAVTNVVAGLVLNGASQATGVYNSTTSPTYISGPGSLEVGVPIASNPTNILFSVSSMGGHSILTLSWPADHLGWILQEQTNSLHTGLGTNWVDVAGSASVMSTNITVNPATPTAFYRLRQP